MNGAARASSRWTAGVPGLVLLALAGAVARHDPEDARGADAPLALALAPLGPIRALVSSALWVDLLHGQSANDSERVATVAGALLEVHPDLDVVREYLADQLIVTEARRAPDAARQDALIEAGLRLYEDGLQSRPSRKLRSALAWTLATQARIDVRFAIVAGRWFGRSAEDTAIDLLEGSEDPADARTRGVLLVERGLSALSRRGDRRAAQRDLAEAERAVAPLAAHDADGAGDVLAPLQAALTAESEPVPESPAPGPEPAVPGGVDEHP